MVAEVLEIFWRRERRRRCLRLRKFVCARGVIVWMWKLRFREIKRVVYGFIVVEW